MRHQKCFFAHQSYCWVVILLLLAGISHAAISLKGRVVDRQGNPLKDVVVFLDKTRAYDTTDANGFYFLDDNSISNSILPDRTVHQNQRIVLRNDILTIVLDKPELVTIDLYALNGRSIYHYSNRMELGVHKLSLYNKSIAAPSIKIFRARIGNATFTYKGCFASKSSAVSLDPISSKQSANSGEQLTLAKNTSAIVDTLIAEKPGYINGYRGITTLQDSLSDIQLFMPNGMSYIKNGQFTQGYNSGSSFEMPAHTVSLSYNFFIDTTEVTQKDYMDLTGRHPWSTDKNYGRGNRYPVYNLTWYDAVLYCNAKSKKEHLDTVYSYDEIKGTAADGCVLANVKCDLSKIGYRLPTEAEWEYAYRAGTETAYFWGSDTGSTTVKKYAWYRLNSDSSVWTDPHATKNGSQVVGSTTPNNNHLYDMGGNVWEWCNDWYRPDYYSSKAVINPAGPTKDVFYRAIRGGCWFNSPISLRATYRIDSEPNKKYSSIGFRTVLPTSMVPHWQFDSSSTLLPSPGKWKGGLIEFTVAGTRDNISTMTFGPLSFSGGTCTMSSTTKYMYYIDISNKSFTETSTGLTVKGTFYSKDSAAGTYSYSEYSTSCKTTFSDYGSWSAKFVPAVEVPDMADTLPYDTIIVSLPSTPALSTPTNAASVYLPVTLSWTSVTNAQTYHVQISNSSSFFTITAEDSTLISTSKDFSSLTQGTTYYWRVRAKNSAGVSSWSTYRSFTVQVTPTTPPATPVLSSPSNGAINVPLNTSLSWLSANTASSYHIQISKDSVFSTITIEDSLLSSTSKTISSLDTNSIYFWRVRAKNVVGVSGWSSRWSFTTSGSGKTGRQYSGRMVKIPGGSFIDGDGNSASISYAFNIDTTEVTEQLYSAIMLNASSTDFTPAKGISWYQAILFCNARSKKEGFDTIYSYSKVCTGCGHDNTISLYDNFDTLADLVCNWSKSGYRLPTEDEWELAARAGQKLAYPTADGSINCSLANYNPNPIYGSTSGACKGNLTAVATYPPNPYGVYDMAGNIIEWCWDKYGATRPASRTDYKGGQTGIERTARGGDYAYWPVSSGSRLSQHPARKININTYFGFRCVRLATTPIQPSNQWSQIVGSAIMHLDEDRGLIEPPPIQFHMPKQQVISAVGQPDSTEVDSIFESLLYKFHNMNVVLGFKNGQLLLIGVQKDNEAPSVPTIATNTRASLESTQSQIISQYGQPADTSGGTLTYMRTNFIMFDPAGSGSPGASIIVMSPEMYGGLPLAKRRF